MELVCTDLISNYILIYTVAPFEIQLQHKYVVTTYQVALLMYCFQESLSASRPPPVAFSPPNAPPISAPLVGMFTFTIPQSLPWGLHNTKGKSDTFLMALAVKTCQEIGTQQKIESFYRWIQSYLTTEDYG
jgi:hypothetical protein